MRSKTPLFSGIAVIIMAALLFGFGNKLKRDSRLYENELEKQYSRREMELQTSLRRNDSSFKVLGLRFDSVVAVSDSLARQSVKLDGDLLAIPGSFNNKNSQQLEAEMLRRYNEAH